MKYLITESQMTNVIESLIKKNFPDVVSVNFREKSVAAWETGENGPTSYSSTVIQVIIDPGKVLEGNLYDSKSTDIPFLKMKILKLLNNILDIDIKKFKSPYDLEIYVVKTQQV